MNHKFPYRWTLKEATFTKDKGKVFSCFACGGGSTMGYKLAGFDVIGFNEIDKKMADCYIANHNPKYAFIEPIQTFKDRTDLPAELSNLDILDGSPPCSSFSMAGNREKDWGKEKKFREGQSLQVLDTLFFDFIDLAKKLQPKVVIAENVKGLLLGSAKSYVIQIYKAFDAAGYYLQHFLLDASKMGVPQKRERVFFVALRKDLAKPFLYQKDMFSIVPKLELKFNEKEIPFKEIEDFESKIGETKIYPSVAKLYPLIKKGDNFSTKHEKQAMHSMYKIDESQPLKTITAHINGGDAYHYSILRSLTKQELVFGGSFPLDYNFLNQKIKYLIGMSVPPVMTAQVVTSIYEQWKSIF